MTNFDPIDPEDLRKLAVQVFRQALEDYIHLQHPLSRSKKHSREAFSSAVDMFWSPDYHLDYFLDENEMPMALEDFLKLASDRSNLDIESFREYLQAQSKEYWRDKFVNTILIPDIVIVCETPYEIQQIDITAKETYMVDYEKRIIYLDKTLSEANNMRFVTALIEVVCFHEDLRVAKATQKILGQRFYEILKMNNSFKEIVPRQKFSRLKSQLEDSPVEILDKLK